MMESSARSGPRERWLLLVFFLSGTAALIYELVWFHLVQLVVGASSISVAALLASFMGGMALGSLLLPRIVSPARHPFRVIAVLEGAMAAIGLAMPLLLPTIQSGYLAMVGYGYAGILARAVVCALALLPPTLLMGATLPAIARWTNSRSDGAAAIGRFYMANIAGGACGTVLAGFYLLRVFDTLVATAVAVALNLIAAALAFTLARQQRYAPVAPSPADAVEESGTGRSRAFVYVVAGLSGLTALGAEVVWTRQLSLLFGASVYTFSLILAVFLGGLGLGSLGGSALLKRRVPPVKALLACQLLLVLAIAYASRAIADWLPLWQPTASFLPSVRVSPALTFLFDAMRAAAALLPATLLWGASFPLAVAAAGGGGRDAGRLVARVNATNTIGALAGAIGFTLIGIPVLGSQHAQQTLVAVAGAAAIVICVGVAASRRPHRAGPGDARDPGRRCVLARAAGPGTSHRVRPLGEFLGHDPAVSLSRRGRDRLGRRDRRHRRCPPVPHCRQGRSL